MDHAARQAKKRVEAERLRALPPERTLQMSFQMMQFVRDLAEAADRARA